MFRSLPSVFHLRFWLYTALTLSLCVGVSCSDNPTTEPAQDTVSEPDADVVEETSPDVEDDPVVRPDIVDTPDADTTEGDADLGDVHRVDAPIEDGSVNTDVPIEDGMIVYGVNPERGSTEGNTEILVIGLGFTVDTDIYIGSILCGNIDFVDETKIICFTPPNPAGDYDVKAVNGEEDAWRPNAFEYFAPLALGSIEPPRGPTSGGMPATVYGEGFTPETQVSIGGNLALGVEYVSASEVRLITPPGESGLARLQVSNENGLDADEEGFDYYQPLTLDRILPAAGRADGGTKVDVIGLGFDEAEDFNVYFGLLEATRLEFTEEGGLIATAPAGPEGQFVDVTVTSSNNGEFSLTNAFYYYPPETEGPVLFSVRPSTGSTSGGTEVVLSGLDLEGTDSVEFGGAEGDILETEDEYLIVETPAHAEGDVDVAVFDGDDSSTLEAGFAYVTSLTIDELEPENGNVRGGTSFRITGEGFVEGTVVRFGALPAADLEVESDELLGFTPPGTVGLVDVTVTTPDGVLAVIEDGFLYTQNVAVHGIDPTKGAISGGTFVVLRGAGFVEPLSLFFDDVPATDVTILDSATVTARTPAHIEGYVPVSVQIDEDAPVEADFRFLYYDPLSITGGSWGDEIVGAVNVTVLSDGGTPLPDAYVQLSVRADALYSGTTDANGQVTLSGPDLSGAQTVTATRLGFSSSTVQAVNAENITVILSCVPENMCGSTGDCREEFVCTCGPPFGPMGICLVDNFCGIEIETQEQYDEMCVPNFDGGPFGVITGMLTGVHKVADPGPGERIMGMVITTDPHPFQATPIPPGDGNVLENDGEYTLRSRLGEIALVGVCGIYNDITETFTAKYMGVRRGLFIVEGEVYDVDIDCNIKLDVPLTIKSVNPPLAPGGPDVLRHQVYLHFGSEGYTGVLPPVEGTDDTLTGCCYAPLEGELAGLDYYVLGGAYTGNGTPYSRSILEGVNNTDEIIVLPEFVPVPELVVPRENGLLVERYFEWQLETDVLPDFYYLYIEDANEIQYWDVYVPGDQNIVNLPFWPDDAEVGLFPAGQLILVIIAVDAFSFDYDQFDFNDFSITNWESFSINGFLFNNPG